MTSRRAPVLTRLLREEEGSFLVEIIVSAIVLLTVALGVVATFDTGAAQSSQQRAQAVASNLAASELERLRSLRFSDLAGETGSVTKEVAGIVYTIATDVGETGTPAPAGGGCESATRSADALRATTTVTWPSQGSQRPVTLTSLIAAPANASSTRGSVVVQVVNREGFGVSGLSISLVGASSLTATTDANGCARFTDLLAGPGYDISFSRPDWVDPSDRNVVEDTVDVVAGTIQTKSYQYDPAARITASFFSKDRGSPTRYDAPQGGVTFTSSSLNRTQTVSPAAATVESVPLPVSTSPYGVYADVCAAAQPPAGRFGSVLSPGSVQVQVPLLRVRVRRGNQDVVGALVFATTSCGTRIALPATTLSAAEARTQGGVPYANGTLSVCAQFEYQGTTRAHTITGQSNTSYGTYGLTGNGDRNDITLSAGANPPVGTCS